MHHECFAILLSELLVDQLAENNRLTLRRAFAIKSVEVAARIDHHDETIDRFEERDGLADTRADSRGQFPGVPAGHRRQADFAAAFFAVSLLLPGNRRACPPPPPRAGPRYGTSDPVSTHAVPPTVRRDPSRARAIHRPAAPPGGKAGSWRASRIVPAARRRAVRTPANPAAAPALPPRGNDPPSRPDRGRGRALRVLPVPPA